MNIILVVLDTMRYDFIGAYGKQKIKTPKCNTKPAGWHQYFEDTYVGS